MTLDTIPKSHQVNISVGCYKRSTTTRFLLAANLVPAPVGCEHNTWLHQCQHCHTGRNWNMSLDMRGKGQTSPLVTLPSLSWSDHAIVVTVIRYDKPAAKSKWVCRLKADVPGQFHHLLGKGTRNECWSTLLYRDYADFHRLSNFLIDTL